MPSRKPAQRLQDILDNIEMVRSFTSGLDQESFLADRKTLYAVSRALEIISEASRRLPKELKDRHPDIPWQDIAAAGNVYRHEYEAIDHAITWKTATQELDALEAMAKMELDRP